MSVEFDDIINVSILRNKYADYESAIKGKVLSIIREFISFIRYIKTHTKSSKLLDLLNQQEKIAKRILLIYRIRFILFMIYKEIIENMINKLLRLIRAFISLI